MLAGAENTSPAVITGLPPTSAPLEKGNVVSAGTEAFMAFMFTNWRKIAKDNRTDNIKKIVTATEKLFNSLVTPKPKKPANAYLRFCKQVFKDVTNNLRDAESDAKGASREISRRWKQLSAEEKAPFVEEAKREEKEYLEVMKKYHGE